MHADLTKLKSEQQNAAAMAHTVAACGWIKERRAMMMMMNI
jgi:hypothetical protein